MAVQPPLPPGGASPGHIADFRKFFYWLFGINVLVTLMTGLNLKASHSPAVLAGFIHDSLFTLALLWAHFYLQRGHVRLALEVTFWGLLLANLAGILQPQSFVGVGLVSVVCCLLIAPFFSGPQLVWRVWVAWGSTLLCLVGGLWVHESTDMSPAGFSVYRVGLLSLGSGVALLMIFKSRTRLDEAAQAREAAEQRALHSQRLDAIGQLAGGVAHDFNNLLAVIQLHASAAGSAKSVEAMAPHLERVQSAAQKGAALTRQLMVFGRGQLPQPQALDLGLCIQEASQLLARLLGEGIALRQKLSDEPIGIMADPDQVSQVLVNLGLNARDAMPGGGTLTLETALLHREGPAGPDEEQLPSGDLALLTVSDTGQGMDAATLQHIFEPFFTTKERGKGTGLGLSVVHGIVKNAGGFISASSQLGQGSSFKVYWPAWRGPARESLLQKAAPPRGQGERVLLVEDEADLRSVVARTLREHGYQVLEAASAEQALTLMEAEPLPEVDLLFSDMVMPGLGGDELARRLLGRLPDLKVLFSSGYTEHRFQNDPLLKRASFLAKPYSTDAVLAALNKAFGR